MPTRKTSNETPEDNNADKLPENEVEKSDSDVKDSIESVRNSGSKEKSDEPSGQLFLVQMELSLRKKMKMFLMMIFQKLKMPKLTKPKIILAIQEVHKVKEMFQMQIQNLATLIQISRGMATRVLRNLTGKIRKIQKINPDQSSRNLKSFLMKIQKARL